MEAQGSNNEGVFLMSKMSISQNGIDLIKSFEGLRLTAYKALVTEKYYTIGYGHYGSDVHPGQTITEKQAEDLLRKDLQAYVDGVNEGLKITVSQNQFDALVSLCYNIGISAFKSSSLLKRLNEGDVAGAASEFDLWIHSGGRVIDGLVNRRNKEQALFNAPSSNLKSNIKKEIKSDTKKTTKTLPNTYKVKAGDTLTKIANEYKEFGLTVAKIQKLNGLKNPNLIKVGQVLKLKESTSSSSYSGIKAVGKIKVDGVKNFTYIYSKTNDTSATLAKAKKNDVFEISGSVPGWWEVIYKGKRAYIKEKYASRI